jgi:hypothetical protein
VFGADLADTCRVLSLSLALALRDAGLRWLPAPGDRFVLPHRNMDDEVFVLSDMTVEVHDFPSGSVIGFNGVTEWALDSVQQEDAVWMPSEAQLRERLGNLFTRLEAGPDGGFRVTVTLPHGVRTFAGADAGDAYGSALLAILRSVTRSDLADEDDKEDDEEQGAAVGLG